jgi:RHS repeat-associated protein
LKTRSLGDQNFNISYEYYAWDASHGQGRLRSQVTTRLTDNVEIQNLRYEDQAGSVGYDAVGNLQVMTEWRNGLFQTQSYQYDGLNRLTHASAANPAYSEEYTYDATTGNLSSKAGVSYTYGSSHPHAVTGLNGQQLYAYDANGNMTSRTVNGVTYTLSYDGENHLTALSGGGLSARYGYDGDGKRVLAVIGSTRTVYIGDYFEAEIGAGISSVSAPTLANHNPTCDEAWCKRNYLTLVSNPTPKNPNAVSPLSGNYGATRYHTHPWTPPAGIQWRIYYYAGTQRIAQRIWNSSGSTLNFLLSDHLGSTRQVIDADGNRVEEIQYKAWGETLTQTGSDATRRKYTGQVESEAGLYFYNARYYDPYLNRFLSPDDIVSDPYDPLDWDRYSYSRNNPVKYMDPSGHSVACGTDVGNGCEGTGLGDATPSDIINSNAPEEAKDRAVYNYSITHPDYNYAIDAELEDTGRFIAGNAIFIGNADAVYRQPNLLDRIKYSWTAYASGFSLATAGIIVGGGSDKPEVALHNGMTMRVDDALDAATQFLGEGYIEVEPGRFVSKDGFRQVRMLDVDILGKHGGGPHMNFETWEPRRGDPSRFNRIQDLHIYLK